MIQKICKIKNLRLVFPNYVWDNNLPPFKQFNLVYGWNGCGKTTLSRLFEVWDTFLMFRVPNGKSFYKKIEELKEAGFDDQKLDAIYKFTNDQSHITGAGFNPALVPETKKVVKELFDMMAEISPDHFKIIDAATN
jgi:wobble nucleotide-excising tRNase